MTDKIPLPVHLTEQEFAELLIEALDYLLEGDLVNEPESRKDAVGYIAGTIGGFLKGSLDGAALLVEAWIIVNYGDILVDSVTISSEKLN